jgi:hypothetical protein
MKTHLILFITLALALDPSRGQEAAGVPVTIPAYSIEGVSQPIDPNHTGVLVHSGEKQFLLPPSADACIVKESNRSNAGSMAISLRDGRWTQGLIKLDLGSLAPDTPVDSAVFSFKAGGVERSGNAVFKCHRILVDWSESATWFKPFAEKDGVWNGLKAGADFETEPFATFQTDDLKKGDQIEIPGFEKAINAWRNGTWKNQGFLITLAGRSLQTSFPSREEAAHARDFALGGPTNGRMIVKFDPALIARVLLQPDDLLGSTLRLRLADQKKIPAGAAVRVSSLQDKKELASIPAASASPEGWIEIKNMGAAMREDPSVAVEASAGLRMYAVIDEKSRPQLELLVRDHPKATLFDHALKPRPGVYNAIKDGHFNYGGERLRLWGMVGYGEVDRLRKMGFNAQRVWDPALSKIFKAKDFPPEFAKLGQFPPQVKGDGSNLDEADQHFADLKAHGMFVMFAALADTIPLKPLLVDDSFIAGGKDWAEWKQAVAAEKDDGMLKQLAVYFDDRIQRVRMKGAETILNHVNPYTGKRYAEEENIALYEDWNENGGVYRFLNDDKKLPPFFQHEEQAQWSGWLRAKYKDEAGVKKAWGRLEAGETLENVKLAPSLAERGAYPDQRGRDYSEFLYDAVSRFDIKYRAYCRTLAPKGVGVNVVPFSFDTQYRPSVPWVHVDAQGDVNSHGMYFWNLKSGLNAPPSGFVIDSHTVDGMPTVLYETNQARPNPNRTEYPFKLAAMASWQDWDGIFWHYWAAKDMKNDEEFMAAVMPHVTATHIWLGIDHERDPVMTSAMALAGRIFLNREIKPAPAPAIYRIGRKGIFGIDYANGIGLARAMFQRGARIKFEPQSDTLLTIENGVPDEPVRDALKSGDEILWDWPKARLIIDTPSVKAYVGKVDSEPFKFTDGTVLSGISTPWICWGLTSADGKPLTETKQAFVTALYDARNTGFDFDWTVAGSVVDQAKAIRNRGRAPAIVDKVDYTLSFPTQDDFHFAGYDFATRKVLESSGTNSNVLRVKNRELWMGVVDFARHGANAPAVADANTGATKETVAGGEVIADDTNTKLAGIWNPIPGLQWGDSYSRAHKTLNDAGVAFTSISPEDKSRSPDKTINWMEAQVLFGSPANFDVTFEGGKMTRIAATFTRPPDMKEVVAAYEKQFGPAIEKVFTRQEEQSIARWTVKAPPVGTLEIKVTEVQGTQVITYDLRSL